MAGSKQKATIRRIVGAKKAALSGFHPYEAVVPYRGIELVCSAPLSIEMKIVELGGSPEEALPHFKDLDKSVLAERATKNPESSDYACLSVWHDSLSNRIAAKGGQSQAKPVREKIAVLA